MVVMHLTGSASLLEGVARVMRPCAPLPSQEGVHVAAAVDSCKRSCLGLGLLWGTAL